VDRRLDLAEAIHSLRRSPGTYALIVTLDRSHFIRIGRRGRFHFPAGFYVYVGSALGPGGLAGRLKSHLRKDKRLYWHIDYLLRHARVEQVWVAEGANRRECEWVRTMMAWPGASIVAPRFGASDCQCESHLIAFDVIPDRDWFALLAGDEVKRWQVE